MAHPLFVAIEQAISDSLPATLGDEECRRAFISPLIIARNGERAPWHLRFRLGSIQLDMSTGTTNRVEAMVVLEAVRSRIAEYQLKALATEDELRATLALQDVVEADCGCGKQRCGLTPDDEDEDELRALSIRESGNSLVVLATMLSLNFWIDHKSSDEFIVVYHPHINKEAAR